MIDSIITLLTAEDCDTAIQRAQEKRLQTEFDRFELEQDNRKAAIEGPNYEHALVETQDKIIGLQAAIAGSPEGPGKVSFQLELKKYEIKLASLQNKQGNYGQQSMLDQQCDYTSLGGALEGIDAYIAAVNARKAAL